MAIVQFINGQFNPVRPMKQMTGEKIPGELRTWDYFGTDPNDMLLWSYDVLSQRSTTLYHTHPPVAAAVNKQTNYAIGTGLRFRSQPDWEILEWTKEDAKEWGMRFQKLVHYVFLLLNFYEKQPVLFKSSLIMGDSLLFFDRLNPSDNLPFDLIETGGDQIKFEKLENGKCTLGIYHDEMLRRKGIATYNKDRIDFKNENGDQNVIQFYLKQMARQLRGLPLAYKIIALAKNNDRWWDATLARAVLESIVFANARESYTGESKNQMEALADALYNEDGSQASTSTLSRENVYDLGVGNVVTYGKDGGIEFTDIKTPSNNFDKMHKAYIEMVGMGTDTPPECVSSIYSTSYTAHKGALNDFQKSFMSKRHTFSRNVCHVTLYEVAKYLFREQMIEMPNGFFDNPIIREATLKGVWLGPVPGHVNPQQEVNALVTAKDNAFITPADAAATFANVEWDDQIEEWSRQMEEWQRLAPNQQAQVLGQDMDEREDEENNNPDENIDTEDEE